MGEDTAKEKTSTSENQESSKDEKEKTAEEAALSATMDEEENAFSQSGSPHGISFPTLLEDRSHEDKNSRDKLPDPNSESNIESQIESQLPDSSNIESQLESAAEAAASKLDNIQEKVDDLSEKITSTSATLDNIWNQIEKSPGVSSLEDKISAGLALGLGSGCEDEKHPSEDKKSARENDDVSSKLSDSE